MQGQALAFLIAQFGINIAGNAVSGGIDLASLLPKYINIRRGRPYFSLPELNSANVLFRVHRKLCKQSFFTYTPANSLIETTAMALPMCPWALVSGATVFISVMSGYATFLAPITGLMVFDYVFVRKQKMKLSSLVRSLLLTPLSIEADPNGTV